MAASTPIVVGWEDLVEEDGRILMAFSGGGHLVDRLICRLEIPSAVDAALAH